MGLAALAEALAAGAFGVPPVFADGELLFGGDSPGHPAQCPRGEAPLSQVDLERWRDLPATVSRR